MEVRICKKCGRMFQQRGFGDRRFCPACRKEEDERQNQEQNQKLSAVEKYVKEHPTAHVEEVSYRCNVNVSLIEKWAKEGKLGEYRP